MCDVPSKVVFCSESIECFPGIASRFVLMLFVTVPVAPIITGIIVDFRFHVCCISIPKALYFYIFPLPIIIIISRKNIYICDWNSNIISSVQKCSALRHEHDCSLLLQYQFAFNKYSLHGRPTELHTNS
jgi:hypothetical protein